MPISYPIRHTQFMNYAKHTSCSIIYISLIIQSYSTKTDHLGTNRHPITALSRPAPRSGWGVSLERDSLARARQSRSSETVSLRRAPPLLRRGHKNRSMSNAGSRLGEIPLAWASCLLAQKPQWVPWATIHGEKGLGEPLLISPRRD